MSEPSSAYSYEDLILRIAREAGIAYHGASGSEPTMIPVDEDDLNICKRIVNDGIKMFIADAPAKGWRWMRRIMSVVLTAIRITGTVDSVSGTAPGSYTIVDATLSATYDTNDDLKDYYIYILTGTGIGRYAKITAYTAASGTCTVADWLDENGNAIGISGGAVPAATDTFAITPVETIGGDIARYPLPENFDGEVTGEIHYSKETNHSTLIQWVDEALIRNRRAITVNTGYPFYAAIRPFEPVLSAPSAKRRFELILDPQPVATDTLQFPYVLSFDKLRLVGGLASSGGATTLVDSSFANLYPDDYFNGWKVYIINGTGKNARAVITDFAGSTFTITVADWLAIDDSTASAADPTSDSAYYLVPVNNLHPAGLRFDKAILSACYAKAEMELEDAAAGFVKQYIEKDLIQAYKIDVRSAPRKLGSMNRGERYVRERTWLDVSYD